jgi:hypothetical protein
MAGSLKSREVTAKKEFETGRNGYSRSLDIIINGLRVGSPQSVKCHRMASLKLISKLAT